MPRKAAKPQPAHVPPTRSSSRLVRVGDTLEVERRYVVDGSLTSVRDKGTFVGIQVLGTLEHLVLEAENGTRMIPLVSIAEILLASPGRAEPDAADPSVA